MICQLIKDKPSVIFKSYHLKTVLLELITASDQEKIENTYFFFCKIISRKTSKHVWKCKISKLFYPITESSGKWKWFYGNYSKAEPNNTRTNVSCQVNQFYNDLTLIFTDAFLESKSVQLIVPANFLSKIYPSGCLTDLLKIQFTSKSKGKIWYHGKKLHIFLALFKQIVHSDKTKWKGMDDIVKEIEKSHYRAPRFKCIILDIEKLRQLLNRFYELPMMPENTKNLFYSENPFHVEYVEKLKDIFDMWYVYIPSKNTKNPFYLKNPIHVE